MNRESEIAIQGGDATQVAIGINDIRAACPSWAQNLVMAGYRGSESHGTSLFEGENATDDVDVFAVSVQTPEWYMGLPGYSNSSRQTHETAGDHLDLLVYDVRKFFSLLAKGNPNVHVFLWLKAEHWLLMSEPGSRIVENRRAFLSTSCLDALCGYAMAQFKNMGGDQLYQGYMGAKRKGQVDRYGYDIKNAAHCIRLLHMGRELCTEGTLNSWRPEAERAELISIKRGEWPLADVRKRADELWAHFYAIKGQTGLPDRPDYDTINSLLVEVIQQANTSEPPTSESEVKS